MNNTYCEREEDHDEEDDRLDEKDFEKQQERENEELSACWCGAYRWSDKSMRFVQVADCICGRT